MVSNHSKFVRGLVAVFLVLLLLAAAAPMAQAAVWYVNAASTAPTPDGTSWATAYPAIQTAVNAAVSGDEAWVAKGSYTGTGTDVVNLKAGVALYGGFTGTETARDQRNWEANVTIIDGQQSRRGIFANTMSSVNGFTVRNGRAIGMSGGGMCGGTATNCTFTANTAGRGGGVYGSTAVNCMFTGNLAGDGGGASGATAINCAFTGNSTDYDGYGGGTNGGTAVNCIVWGNVPDETNGTTVSYSCLSVAMTGTGNVVGNPRFVNPLAGDLRLRAGSPCVDAGTSSNAPATDLRGRARPAGAGVDMGAYEYYSGDDSGAGDAPILRVNAASTAANPDGLTWETAYPTLQAAADGTGYGGEIWVAAGIYTGTGAEVVKLQPGTAVFGGFVGTETARGQRDAAANPTVIDGQQMRRAVTDSGVSSADGFTIRNGKASSGGGMYFGSVVNCTFTGNSATRGGGVFRGTATDSTFAGNAATNSGGGVYEGTAVNCTFTENTGGGMHSGTATHCTFTANLGIGMYGGTATHCTFTGNTSSGMGDGAAVNCTFTGNSADSGGGMNGGTATNCMFSGNTATNRGGGMFNGTAINCAFAGNLAVYGGGMNHSTSINCTFTGNSATVFGAGLYTGTATNCIIWGNVPSEIYGTTVSYSCLSAAATGPGNIVGAPRFVNPLAGDLRLRADSPCVDTGTLTGAPSTDLPGRSRPTGAGVDMGAYEYTSGDDAQAVDAPILRVNAASTVSTPDGLTWETAYSTLQSAADHTGYGGEIWVAAGNYTGTGNEVILLHPGTTMFGGFAGSETARGQRNAAANPTVIDGQQARRGVTADDTSSVDGVTIRNGTAKDGGGMWHGAANDCAFAGNSASDHGGGMYYGTANNCTFTGNSASDSGGGTYYGTATNCAFTGNSATYSGGGMCYGTTANCTFNGNSTPSYGGGLYKGTALSCTFTGNSAAFGGGMSGGTAVNCIIWCNTPDETQNSTVSYSCLSAAATGTGNIVGDPRFVNPLADDFRLRADSPCVDMGTSADAPVTDLLGRPRPGGAKVDMGAYEYYSGDDAQAVDAPILRVNAASAAVSPDGLTWGTAYPTLQAAADGTGYGGEIWVAGGNYTGTGDEVVRLLPGVAVFGGFAGTETARDQRIAALNPTVIDGQQARRGVTASGLSSMDGFIIYNGKSYNGGGMYLGTASNCTFLANSATNNGGGLYYGAAANCVFSGNVAPFGAGLFGGTANNCTISLNWASSNGGGMYNGTAVNCIIWGNVSNETYSTTVSYSCLSVTTSGTGNIKTNPLLVNAAAGDFHLQAGSPCINAGTSDGPGTDILGMVRPQGTRYDMGAYEVPYVSVPDASGLVRSAARQLITSAQLYVRDETDEYHPTVPGDHVIRETPLAGTTVPQWASMDLFISKGPRPISVPNVVGLVQDTAANTLAAAGLVVGTVTQQYSLTAPADSVISQSVAAGTQVLPGTPVDLIVSKGPQPVPVPNVVGQPQSTATTAITEAGLAPGPVTQQYSATVPTGTVISQNPPASTLVLPGTPIGLVVSKGPQPVPVPNVVNQPQSAASAAITNAELLVGTITQQYSATVPSGTIISQNPAAGTPALPGTTVDLVVSKGQQTVSVPNVLGQAQSDATASIMNVGLAVGTVTQQYSATVPVGAVISQNPAAGVSVLPGVAVNLLVSKGPQFVTVPGVAGKTQSAATTDITGAGLAVGTVTRQYSATVPADAVISQNPTAGTSVLPGTAVSLVVSNGAQPVAVPDLAGLTRAQAETAITGAGLAVGTVTEAHSETVVAGSVVSQSPAAGTEQAPGTAVNLVVSLGPVPVEGEPAEGEGEPVDADAARQQLADAFDSADTNGDGTLSLTEATAVVPGLTQTVFNELDTNGDGQLSADELGVAQETGCAGCRGGKSTFDPGRRIGDLFLMGLGLMGLAILRRA